MKEAEFVRDKRAREEQYDGRMVEYNKKPKSAKSSQPPRMARSKVVQLHFCGCWYTHGKKCPECKGKAPWIQDPNGRPGDMISSCAVCRCPCCVGPYKNADRDELAAAFHDFQNNKTEYPTVSEHRESGIQDINQMTELCLQVSCILFCVSFISFVLSHFLSLYRMVLQFAEIAILH